MATQDTVHQLIKTMSRTEKAYFKKYARKQQREKDDFYFKLFDAIDKQKEYNGNALIKKFKKEKLTTKQLSITKHYLYNLLINTLREYQQGKSVHSQLHEQIDTIKLLYERELPAHALKTLYKAQKFAEKHEEFLYLLILKELEEEILRVKMLPEIDNYIESGFDKEEQINNQWLNYRQHRYLATKAHMWTRKQYSSRTKASDDLTNALFEEISTSTPPQSIKAYSLHYHSLNDYYNQKGDFHLTAETLSKHLQLLEDHPEFAKKNTLPHIAILNNLGVNQVNIDDFEGLLATVSKLQNFPTKTIYEELQVFEAWSQSLLVYITYSDSQEDHLEKLQLIEEKYNQLETQIGHDFKVVIPYGLASGYFWRKDYNKAIDWLLITQENGTKAMMPDLKIAARLINLIVHYELDNQYYLLNANDATYRHLSYNGRLYKLEAALLKFLRKLAALPLYSSPKDLLKAFKIELLELKEDPMEEGPFRCFDFIKWVDSKLNV